ncbi:hypothetical protein QBC39DRAFT_265481 [Podospora conica]|nr:hypothetical protein QBC39DRAFT_265481 [Schizothecium conicum]
MASTPFKKSVSALLNRALYISVHPMPRTLSERRAVLEALKQHSSVAFFKRLHDPSSFVSVTESRASAKKLTNASPLEFSLVRSPSNRLAPLPILSGADEEVTYTVKIFPVEERALWSLLESPHSGPWPTVYGPFHRSSAFKTALKAVIPDDMAAKGLCDWDMSSVRPVGGNESFVRLRQLRKAMKTAPRHETPREIYASAAKSSSTK